MERAARTLHAGGLRPPGIRDTFVPAPADTIVTAFVLNLLGKRAEVATRGAAELRFLFPLASEKSQASKRATGKVSGTTDRQGGNADREISLISGGSSACHPA
jgi:hypothetical protein